MLNALTNVCFEAKNGHDAAVTPFPLMTHADNLRVVCALKIGSSREAWHIGFLPR